MGTANALTKKFFSNTPAVGVEINPWSSMTLYANKQE